MTNIEQKALALVREVLAERNLSDKRAVRREVSPYTEALCRAIEQHEAFRQEVSDECIVLGFKPAPIGIGRFIIPTPKPDPLVEVLKALPVGRVSLETYSRNVRAALDAAGFEIREKGQ